jgi:hypothetical protein
LGSDDVRFIKKPHVRELLFSRGPEPKAFQWRNPVAGGLTQPEEGRLQTGMQFLKNLLKQSLFRFEVKHKDPRTGSELNGQRP